MPLTFAECLLNDNFQCANEKSEGPVCTVLADIKSDVVVLCKGKLGQNILNHH